MAVKLPRLLSGASVVDGEGRPTLSFTRYWQQLVEQIERVFNAIADILGITDQLDQALKQAQTAIETAQQAAQTAQSAATAAQQQNEAQKREAALQSSYIEPASVLTATPTLITIAAHTRYYSDGTSAVVNGGTIPATAPDDVDYVSYDDPSRSGGAVVYVVSATPPVQTGDTHVVGAVQIPTTGTADGGDGPQRPGYVRPRTLPQD
jgi:type II secretory pathway pseudopilin PulG